MTTPEIERELRAVDDALAGRAVDDDLLELAAFATAVREERPTLPPERAAELDARMARRLSEPPRHRRLVPRLGLPQLGFAATALVVIAIGGGLAIDASDSGTDESPQFSSQPAPESAGDSAGAAPGSGADDSDSSSKSAPDAAEAPSVAPAQPPTADGRRDRKVERSAQLTLASPREKVDDVATAVVRTSDRFRGVVLRSDVSTDDASGSARFTLRFPTSRLDAAMAELSKLADVRSRTQSSNDITGSYVDARERLEDARTERTSLLRQLARADSPNETSSIRRRLNDVSREIGNAKRAVAQVDQRATFANVELDIASDEAASTDDEGGGAWTPGDAASDALRVLEVTAGVALLALALGVPLALAVTLLWWAARAAVRRRREAALG